MSSFTTRRRRQHVALALAAVLTATVLEAATLTSATARETSLIKAPSPGAPVAGHASSVEPRKLRSAPGTPRRTPDASWPRTGAATVSVPAPGRTVVAGSLPVAVAAPAASTSRTRALGSGTESLVAKVKVEVPDRAQARKAGVDGILLSVSRADTSWGHTKRGRVGLRLDYSDYAQAYGGAWASRLRLVQLPACALTTPQNAQCRTATPVSAVNDSESQTLTARTISLAATSGPATVLAATAAASGGKGDYAATSLSPSATWQANLQSGDFSWTYPMPTPQVPGDFAPTVALSYSSGAIDGRTSTTNNQSSWIGDGFDLWPGFIERRYKACADDGVTTNGADPGDLCWGYDNATLSFNGRAGELIPAGKNVWKLKNDDGTKVEKINGSASDVRDNGDDDQEYWKVTTTDGTSYYFGYHKLPGWASGKATTDSTWTVPVYGDDDGEPCHASTHATSWCQQAWRWNLDYAVDTHGNAIAYYYNKETNSYGRNLKPADDTPYVRGGYLDHIEYGLNSSDLYTAKALARVDFTSAERCLPQTGVTCAADTIDSKSSYWYDTPWDQNCKAGTDCETQVSPTFWTRKRLTGVTTKVLQSSGSYANVDTWTLAQGWGMADVDYSLLLKSVQHTGKSATPEIALPKVTFDYHQDANRLDKEGDGDAPFIKERLSTVIDESGGQIDVNYSAAACDWNALPTPQTNTTRCYPQYTTSSGAPDPVQQWFNKYVVTSVTATDRTGGAPDQITRYEYLDGAAWHYDDDDGLTKEKYKTWSQWRGYGHVRVKTGGQAGMVGQADHYYLRGMDGDRKGTSTADGTKSVTIGNGEGTTLTDHQAWAGFEYRSESYSGVGGRLLSKTVTDPWSHETASRVRSWGTTTANLTASASQRTLTSLDDGAGAKWRTTSTVTTHEDTAGRVVKVDDLGDTGIATDNRCTRTTYADNATKWILNAPSRVETVAASCDSTTVDRSKDVISDVRTAYDGGSYGGAPTKGDATTTGTLTKHDGSNATYTETATTLDSYGRQLTVTDVSGTTVFNSSGAVSAHTNLTGRTTSTTYTPSTGLPTTVKVTSPPATAGTASTAQTTTSTLDPVRGQAVTVLDTNNKRTDYAFDALGRQTKIWLPNRSKANNQTPNYEFSYTVADNAIVAIGTKTLVGDTGQQTKYVLYDGFLRPRQSQEPGPDGGQLLTDIFYDERGLTKKTFASYYATGAPTGTLRSVDNALSVETQTWYDHDGLGRVVTEKQVAGNGDGGKVLGVTTTTYGGDRTNIDPPEGGTPSTVITDARGQTRELWQYRGDSPSGEHDTTSYSYTPAGNLAGVTDPVGNTWTYGYDQRGLLTTTKDPDRGQTTLKYDDYGQLTSTEDARAKDNKLFYGYDGLGRKTSLRADSATGTLLAEWAYDPAGYKGQLASATRYVSGNAYKYAVNIYDTLYRPNRETYTIPASEGTALAGSYQVNTRYNADGTVASVSYPAAGSLPSETVTPTYDEILRPKTLASEFSSYVTGTTYSFTGLPQQFVLAAGGKKTAVSNTYEWGTRRLATSRVDREDVAGVDRYATYSYDQAGNVLSVVDTSRDGTDAQCFRYDYLHRLAEAWAQSTSACASTPSAAVLGGPAPYWTSYTYDKAANGSSIGNRATEVQHNTGGDTAKDVKRTYTYPAAGTAKPHTLSSVTTTSPSGTTTDIYGYDEVGNTTTRKVGGVGQALSWDAEGHLSKVVETTGSTTKTTSYVYDANGNRLVRDTDGTKTVYLGGTELTLAKGATTAKATRYYDVGGGTAVRTDDSKVTFLIDDHHGTAELAIKASDLSMSQRRTIPFGGYRGTTPTYWPTDRGFVGGAQDSTGLTHLGAREYDPSTGRFISIDPIMDLADPQQINGYAYANNSPVTFSDASGLMCIHGAPGGGRDGICAGVPGDTDGVINESSNNCRREQSCYDTAVDMARAAEANGTYGKSPTQVYRERQAYRDAKCNGLCGRMGIPQVVWDEWRSQQYKPTPWYFRMAYELSPLPDFLDCADTPGLKSCGILAAGIIPAAKGVKGIKIADEAIDAYRAERKAEKAAEGIKGADGVTGLKWEANPKHGKVQRGNAAPEPLNPEGTLGRSVQVGPNSTRRVGVDHENGEFAIFDETYPESNIFHGHSRSWSELNQSQKNALVKAGLVTRRGKILP